MKIFVVSLLALASFACAEFVQDVPSSENTAYGYLRDIAIPRAETIRKAEEEYQVQQRIVGGLPAGLGQYPHQAGLLLSIIGFDNLGVCSASLISTNRVLTAAHCWFDGRNQVWRITVVLGSILLFSGGQRIDSSAVAMHPNWIPTLVRNDIAVIYLPTSVATSSTIAPIALPSNAQLNEDFVGESVIATGFGLTSDPGQITANQGLSQVRLSVISNSVCSFAFPLLLHGTNICTSGVGGVGPCNGDSGGPLIAQRNGENILIGVTSFGSGLGCESAMPAAYARVTSFMPFISQNL